MNLAIKTEHLTKIYGGRVIAVNDMTLEVPVGSVYGLLGPNGAGKTTTLRLLLGLQRASAGRAEVFGRRCKPTATDVRAMIGYLPTHPVLPGHLCAVEYLDLLGKLCRLPSEIRKPRLKSLLRAVGLLGATHQRIQTFSTGMRTRLGIAASLLADPPLLIWDEPTAGLDPSARRFTLDLIAERAKSRTVIVATHILSDIDQICDHVGVMQEGRMIFSGSMREMRKRLQRDELCLEIDGEPQAIEQVANQVKQLTGIASVKHDPHAIMVQVRENHGRAGVLAQVLRMIDTSPLSLLGMRSTQSDTEYAYLQLLHEDNEHGFCRFDLKAKDSVDAAIGTAVV